MSSDPMTPNTSTDSAGVPSRQASTQPSSPPSQSPGKQQKMLGKQASAATEENGVNMDDEEDDEEGMGVKAKALTNLLKTSSVFVAIMADKMKDQQRRQREEARREAARKRAAQDKEKTNAAVNTAKRATRASEKQDPQGKDGKFKEQDGEGSAPKSKKLPTRGRPKKQENANSITKYLKKEDLKAQEDKPTVQEALDQAAEEYEAKPEGLGAQELVATQQPELVTGGQMKEYQLEGLEWLKSLWMNGLCGILADEMGLGKTIQAISLIAFLKEKNIAGPFLITAPLSTIGNWINEFERWTPDIQTVKYHGAKDVRDEIRRKEMKMQNQGKMDFPVVCTTYEICMNDKKFLSQYQWKYIIVDEGHRLKNLNCRLIKDLLEYKSANRLLLTGTPLQNNISELWSLLHFLLPEVFNDLASFESWFDFSTVLDSNGQRAMVEKRKRNLVSTMHAILKPFLLRRVKTDVESSLPKKREYILYAPLTAEQKELYREIVNGSGRQYLEDKAVERIEARNGKASRTASLKRKAIDSGSSTPNKSLKTSRASTPASTTGSRRGRKNQQSYKDITDREFNVKLRKLEHGDEEEEREEETFISSSEQEEIDRAKTIAQAKREISSKKLQNPVMQARLVCNSPHNFYSPWPSDDLIDETLITASGKMLLLDRLIPRLFDLGHKVLIFSQFQTQLNLLEDWATILRGCNCARIDGAVKSTDRENQIKTFNSDPGCKLFLLSTRAGGQGINLVAADTVILFDSDWNPQQDLQAQDRAHRIGQTRPVIVYRFATKGTVEQSLLEKADSKRRLEKLVIEKGKFKSLLADPTDQEDLKRVLLGDREEDDFEKYEAIGGVGEILSEADLKILTDRSEEAYARAAKGLDNGGEGDTFKAVETKMEGEGLMDGLTSKKDG